ncbi:hypothetical protein J8I26_06445 [Herbaspirillum sp. LeCh32-8]|uniref:hypothetical protein n=1 Tax=Herbaspirillum sp. LeCh32-8 TaxID=2821356 RepID=UPI001AE7DA93|nr:hypothetical protein [Herbaspirillum sp. LeCh32-8]MBP0597732.1 hypothetical protein [Herbaspirillum sp. LeCh32-8]
MRDSPVSIGIYRKHIALYRYLNNAWIFTDLLRPSLKSQAKLLLESKSKAKRRYSVPKRSGVVFSRRLDKDIGTLFTSQHDRGIFETNIISMVSRVEAFIQDCIALVAISHPKKLGLLVDGKTGVPLDLFLGTESREEVIRRFAIMKSEELMYSKPAEYMRKTGEVLSIELDADLLTDFFEIKASRDIIVHNSGLINDSYLKKAGNKSRGNQGEELKIDATYFRHVLVTLKKLSGSIQMKTEEVYK